MANDSANLTTPASDDATDDVPTSTPTADIPTDGPTDGPTDIPTDPSALADATQAEALNNQFIDRQQQLLYTEPDAFYRQQGEDALVATPGILDRLEDLRQETLDAAPTPGIRQHLATSLDGHMVVTHDNVLRHTRREAKAYRAATAQNRIDLLGQQAALDANDPASVALYAQAADGAAREHARVTDTDPDTKARTAASSVWRLAIESALARDDAATADTLHGDAGDALAPGDAAAVAAQRNAAREAAAGRAYAQGLALPAPDPAQPLDAQQALADVDTAHQAATAQNAQEFADNSDQQSTNQPAHGRHGARRMFIDVRFGTAKRDVLQDKAGLDAKVADWLGQTDPNGNPQTKRPPVALWTRMLPDDKKAADVVLAQNALPRAGDGPVVTPVRYQLSADGIGRILQRTADTPIAPDLLNHPLTPDQQNPESPEYVGHIVVLPDGSRIRDPFVENPRNAYTYVTAPTNQLQEVANDARQVKAEYARLKSDPHLVASAEPYLWAQLIRKVGQGGTYDTQREGNQLFGRMFGFKQLRTFRPIANVHVGLFGQQAGLSLDETLNYAGKLAKYFSSNYKPDLPHGLDEETRYFIEEGYKLGRSGMFDGGGNK
jgi:hypothetical protein